MNSSTDADGGLYATRSLATFETPSIVKSFFFSPTPSVENCDRPLLKAALRDRRSVVTVTPGARITNSTGLPSRIGSSAIRRASTTWPSSALVRSTVAASAVTVTSSVIAPTLKLRVNGEQVRHVDLDVVADELAEPVQGRP